MSSGSDILVDLEATDDGGRRLFSGRFVLPLTLGRDPGDGIRLPQDNSRLSRRHLELSETGGRLSAKDISTNGVSIAGDPLPKNTMVTLPDVAELELPGIRLKIQRVGAELPTKDFHIMARVGSKPPRKIDMDENALAVFAKGEMGAALDRRPRGFTAASAEDRKVLAVLTPTGEGISVEVPPAHDGLSVALNRAELDPGSHWMVALDVLTIGGMRLEVHVPGQRAIECVNSACRLLNAYRPEENCRWCGYKLIEGVSRIVE